MESICQLTSSQICGNMCRAADNRQEPTCSPKAIRAEPDRDGGAAGEGAGDGGAEIVTIFIVIMTIVRAAVALVIDLHPVIARTTTSTLKYQTVKGKSDCFAIGWLHHPSLYIIYNRSKVKPQSKHKDQIVI